MAHVDEITSDQAYESDNDRGLSWLKPKFHQEDRPTIQILGYIGSLILTAGAFYLVLNHVLPPIALLVVILTLAAMQAALQLGVFMHVREGRGLAWQLIPLYFVFAVAGGMVGMSIWIMLFKSGVS